MKNIIAGVLSFCVIFLFSGFSFAFEAFTNGADLLPLYLVKDNSRVVTAITSGGIYEHKMYTDIAGCTANALHLKTATSLYAVTNIAIDLSSYNIDLTRDVYIWWVACFPQTTDSVLAHAFFGLTNKKYMQGTGKDAIALGAQWSTQDNTWRNNLLTKNNGNYTAQDTFYDESEHEADVSDKKYHLFEMIIAANGAYEIKIDGNHADIIDPDRGTIRPLQQWGDPDDEDSQGIEFSMRLFNGLVPSSLATEAYLSTFGIKNLDGDD